jgi:MIP family channel proteins
MDQGIKSYWAEFLGTFTLCFIGQGTICTLQMTGGLSTGLLAIAVAHGLALAVMISAFGAVSGGHLNPAVTMSFLVTGRQSLPSAVAYWISQLLGAVVASFILLWIFPASVWQTVHLGAAARSPEITLGAAVLIEFILAFFLITAVWGTAVDSRHPPIGGFGIGLTVTMDILLAGPLTGAAMNPARAFGPAVAAGFWPDHWVYWVGPMLGGALAGLIYSRVVLKEGSAR